MPDSSRSSVDLPAPLCPTRPMRSPSLRDREMYLRASTTTTLDAFRPIAPPAEPRTAFLRERDLASKIGKSTHASTQSTETPPGVGLAGLMGLPPTPSRGLGRGTGAGRGRPAVCRRPCTP